MLQLLPKQEKQSFETFYEENYSKVVQYIWKKLGNKQDSEDLAGEVFLYCYSHYEEYDPEKSAITTWLYMIVNSRLKNHYRDTKTYVDLEDVVGVLQDDSVDLDACVYLEQVKARMAQALQKLPERQRRIVVMSYFEERSSSEIAQIMNMTPVNVRVQLSRALDKLETLCADLLEGVK